MNQPKTIVHDVGDFSALGVAPQLSTAHEQTGVLDAWSKLGLTGHGVKVGIIGKYDEGSFTCEKTKAVD